MFSYQIPPPKFITVSNHAIVRLRERFRLKFDKVTMDSNELTRNLIAGQVSKGHLCVQWLACPFYVNLVQSKYGRTIVIRRGFVFYLCEDHGTTLVVKTVVPRWYMEPKFVAK